MNNFVKAVFAALTAACVATSASAAYPDKPIRLVVPFAPGGTVDLVARILGQRLTENMGQPVIIDNRGGAGGTIAADTVAKARPDGYTLLIAAISTQSFHPLLYKKLPYDPNKDLAQVALFASVPNVLVVTPGLPAKNVKELIALSKSRPNKLLMGSSGNGSVNHMIGELFMFKTGTQFEHVPFKGAGPATVEMIAGRIDLYFGNLPGFLPHIQSGKLRALAELSAKRVAAIPDVPTMKEAGVDIVVDSWAGVLAPAATPKPIIDRLSAEIIKTVNQKATVDLLAAQGALPMPGTSAEYAKVVQSETKIWTEVIKKANITLE